MAHVNYTYSMGIGSIWSNGVLMPGG